MPFPASSKNHSRLVRTLLSVLICLLISLFALAQVNLKYRLLHAYLLSSDAPANKDKPTLFVFEQAETFGQVFQPTGTPKRSDPAPDFRKEMVIGVAIPPTNKPPQLSISKVFVQDSMLTVRYIRIKDTTDREPQPFPSQPTLLLAIPKQTVLKTRLVENGKVVQTIKKRENGQ